MWWAASRTSRDRRAERAFAAARVRDGASGHAAVSFPLVTDQPAPPPEPLGDPPAEASGPSPEGMSQPTPTPTPEPVDRWADPTPTRRPRPNTGPVQYKGDDLEATRGPGLGCFWIQVTILVIFIVLTPLSVAWNWPSGVSAALLFAVIGLLLITGQTIIFLLRLVAADRRGRRRPLASETKTVGELEDEGTDHRGE
jgi:hypothetical protein